MKSLAPETFVSAIAVFLSGGDLSVNNVLKETNSMFIDEHSAIHMMQLPKSGTIDLQPIIQ